MNHKTIFTLTMALIAILGLGVLQATSQTEHPAEDDRRTPNTTIGTAFTYQGQLSDGGSPANGSYDFQFELWTANNDSSGERVGSILPKTIEVEDGAFSESLDFGENVFINDQRFLAIRVKPASSSGEYVTLEPFQELAPVPYAISLVEEGILRKEVIATQQINASSKLVAEGGVVEVQNSGNTARFNLGFSNDNQARLLLTSNNGFAIYNGINRLLHLSNAGRLNINSVGVGTEIATEKFQVHLPTNDHGATKAYFGDGTDGISIFNATDSGFNSFIEGRSSGTRSGLTLVGETRAAYDQSNLTVPLIRLMGKTDGGTVSHRPIFEVSNVVDTLLQVKANGTTSVNVVEITGGADLAEPFVINAENAIEPGMVVVLDPDNPGQMRVSNGAYDPLVAGIVSGAGGINPGLIMQQSDLQVEGETHPVALTGQVYVKAVGPIEIGDLLTTADIPGHAMAATDRDRAFGTVIGKAMSSLDDGTGLVLVLVSLQ